MGLVFYLKTTACGVSKQEAADKAFSQSKELKASVSNALNSEVYLLSGDFMKRCFEWEKALPVSAEELEDQLV